MICPIPTNPISQRTMTKRQAIYELEDACSELTYSYPDLVNIAGPIGRVHRIIHRIRDYLQKEN